MGLLKSEHIPIKAITDCPFEILFNVNQYQLSFWIKKQNNIEKRNPSSKKTRTRGFEKFQEITKERFTKVLGGDGGTATPDPILIDTVRQKSHSNTA